MRTYSARNVARLVRISSTLDMSEESTLDFDLIPRSVTQFHRDLRGNKILARKVHRLNRKRSRWCPGLGFANATIRRSVRRARAARIAAQPRVDFAAILSEPVVAFI